MAPPYRFGKGPIAVALEDYLTDRENILSLLTELQSGIDPERSRFVDYLAGTFGTAEKDHLLDVLALLSGSTDGEVAAAETVAGREGLQRQGVFGAGLRFAAHVAAGLAPDADPGSIDAGKLRRRPHPVEVFWGCGHPYNQSWVSVRPVTADLSIISLVFYSTQPATSLTRAILRDELSPARDLPDVSTDRRSLVVCHADRIQGDARWFRPPGAMGIPDVEPATSPGATSPEPTSPRPPTTSKY